MRLFIAVNFDEDTKERIKSIQDQVKRESGNGKFSLPENLHLTLVFLGETPEERLTEIKAAIKASASGKSRFNIIFSNAGFFRRGGKELWWLGIDEKKPGGEKLKDLQKSLASELTSRNFLIDKRPFSAHITLGREIHNGPWPFKTEEISINVNRISLMLSEHGKDSRGKNKLVYTELFGYDF